MKLESSHEFDDDLQDQLHVVLPPKAELQILLDRDIPKSNNNNDNLFQLNSNNNESKWVI